MKTLDKIDSYLEKMNECEFDKILEGKRKVGGPDYEKFFQKMLKKWKIKSYKDLPKNQQQKFFDALDKGWNAKKETD
jgi:prolyl-tRNA synthetase